VPAGRVDDGRAKAAAQALKRVGQQRAQRAHRRMQREQAALEDGVAARAQVRHGRQPAELV
jgi:hypothetical protein